MKNLILTGFAVACAGSVFAQGTVQFNNRSAPVVTRVYLGQGTSPVRGNGTGDSPAGTTDWTGYTALTGSGWMAAIMGGNGAGLSESALSFGATPSTTTFRSGANAGGFAVKTATINSVAPDAASATLDVFVWDSVASGLTDPAAAYAAWKGGAAWFAGTSGTFTVNAIGGAVNTPPPLTGLQSFTVNTVPEPTSMALAGLGAAALMIFRRRK